MLQHLLVTMPLKKKNQHQSTIRIFLIMMLCYLLHLLQSVPTFQTFRTRNFNMPQLWYQIIIIKIINFNMLRRAPFKATTAKINMHHHFLLFLCLILATTKSTFQISIHKTSLMVPSGKTWLAVRRKIVKRSQTRK